MTTAWVTTREAAKIAGTSVQWPGRLAREQRIEAKAVPGNGRVKVLGLVPGEIWGYD